MTESRQVVVGDVPALRHGLQPRPALLAQLSPAGQGAPVQVLMGMRGAGKTQLAAAYARARLEAGWPLVAWVDAHNAGSLRAGLAAVADAAELSDGRSGRRTADAGQAVRHWLEADGDRCLLVFDNAEVPGVLRAYLPVGGAAQVLITSARESVADLGTRVPVDVFSAEEALALLNERTVLDDEAGATAVAAELGYLPLALDLAAAVIALQHLGFVMYLKGLRAMPVEEYLVQGEQVKEESYPQGAAEAVLLSLEAVRAADQSGVCTRVLEIMAVLSPGGVRRDLLHEAGEAGVLAGSGYTVATVLVDQALEWLASRSLLTFAIDGHTVMMHRLVKRMICDRLARRERLATACLAAASVLEARAEALAGSQDRAAVRDIPQRVSALLDSAAGYEGEADHNLARALLRLRFWALYHLIELGDSTSQAIVVGEPLTADLDLMLGPDHPETLNSCNSLAVAYRAAGRAAEAVPLLERTLVAQTRLLGSDHLDTLMSQSNLASAYRDVGRSGEAILLFERTLAAREWLLGADHPSTLSSRGNLAAGYQDVGRSFEAILLFEQTLAAQERTLAPGHPDTVRSRDILATAYQAAGRSTEAIPLFEQALASYERLLGTDHPDTLRTRNQLAKSYRKTGQVTRAIPLVEQILAARERLVGADHPSTMGARNNLAAAYREAGRAAEAIPLFEQTLAACERLLGADDRRTRATRKNLAFARREAGRAE